MVISQKIKRLNVGVLAGLNGRLNRPHIIAEVGSAGGGNAGKDAGFGLGHTFSSLG